MTLLLAQNMKKVLRDANTARWL